MELSYEVTESDHRYAQKLANRRVGVVLNKHWGVRIASVFWMICCTYFFVAGLIFWAEIGSFYANDYRWVFTSGALGFLGIAIWLVIVQRQTMELVIHSHLRFPVTEKLRTTENGITITSAHVNLQIPWEAVGRCCRTESYFEIDIFAHGVCAIPLSAFETSEQVQQIEDIISNSGRI